MPKPVFKLKILIVILLLTVTSLAFFVEGTATSSGSNQTSRHDEPLSTATFTIQTDGNGNYWAVRYDEEIKFNGTDANTVIQSAIAALMSGEALLIKAGTYPIRRITINKGCQLLAEKGVVFQADDTNVQITDFTSHKDGTPVIRSIAPIIFINSTSNVIISGITIDGNPQGRNFYRDAILIWNSETVTVQNCEIKNVEGCGIITRSSGNYNLTDPSSSTFYTKNIKILDNYIHNTVTIWDDGNKIVKGFGIEIEWSEGVWVERNRVEATQESSFRTHYTRATRFLNNVGLKSTGGEVFDIYRCDETTIRGNYVNSSNPSCYIYEYVTNLLVEDNYFTGNDYPVRVKGMKGFRDKIVDKVTFRKNYVDGAFNLVNNYLNDILVEDNVIMGKLRVSRAEVAPVTGGNLIFRDNKFLLSTNGHTIEYFPCKFVGNLWYNRMRISNVDIVEIFNNEFTSDGESFAIGINLYGNVTYARIIGNYFHDITYQAIMVKAGSTNGFVEVLSNYFDNICTAASQSSACQFPTDTVNYTIIQSNIFRDTQGAYSIQITNTAGVVENNDVDKPISAAVAKVGET